MATLRKWFDDRKIPADAIVQVQQVEDWQDDLAHWADLPHGRWFRKDIPAELLDFEFEDGYGNRDVPCVYVWTGTKVFYVDEYDGSTTLCEVPRHPGLIPGKDE